MKNPESEMHLTLLVFGKRALNLSQCRIVLNPPAEDPVKIAYKQFKLIIHIYEKESNNKKMKHIYVHSGHAPFLCEASPPL